MKRVIVFRLPSLSPPAWLSHHYQPTDTLSCYIECASTFLQTPKVAGRPKFVKYRIQNWFQNVCTIRTLCTHIVHTSVRFNLECFDTPSIARRAEPVRYIFNRTLLPSIHCVSTIINCSSKLLSKQERDDDVTVKLGVIKFI